MCLCPEGSDVLVISDKKQFTWSFKTFFFKETQKKSFLNGFHLGIRTAVVLFQRNFQSKFTTFDLNQVDREFNRTRNSFKKEGKLDERCETILLI